MDDPIVELKTGKIRGLVEKHEDGFDYYAFKGIPYAEPPIGELRFRDPVAKKPWTRVIDCKNYGEKCLQYDFFFETSSINENCLYLNVFSRSINSKNRNDPVIVVIHAGSFLVGSSDDMMYGPDYIIRKNVVLVTVNYRLGVLGFLNLKHEAAPGNQGMKDQLMALQWVQENIQQFGGDPNNVTAYGLSAGATCVHYLALSPLTKGLMHKVILQGAVIYLPWAIMKNSGSAAIKLCSILGKELNDPIEIVEFLRSIEAEKLQQAQESDDIPFGPEVDDKSPNPIIPIDPQNIADLSVPLPCFVGHNSHEAILFFPGLSRKEYFEMCDKDFFKALRYGSMDIPLRYNLTTAQVKKWYFDNEKISCENVDKFVKMTTDFYFLEGVHRFARYQVKSSSSSTYLYLFSYDPPNSLSRSILEDPPKGASHFDEIPYLFKMRAFEVLGLGYPKKGSRQYRMMEQLTEMWTNFARYGKPIVEKNELITFDWIPVKDGRVLDYLNIDDDITMKSIINFNEELLAAKNIEV